MAGTNEQIDINIAARYEDNSGAKKATSDIKEIASTSTQAGDAFSSASTRMIASGRAMSTVGGFIDTHITAPLLGISKTAITSAIDFEYGMQKMSTQYGDVDVNASKLEGTIKSLSTEFGVSASVIQENYYEALSSGIEATQDMGNATEFMRTNLMLSRAGYTDLGVTVDATTSILNAYGMETSETNRIANILLKTQDHGKDSVEDLGKTIARVTPVASNLGVSFEQVGASLTQLSMSGNPTAQSVTMLRSLMLELSDANRKGAKSFKQITDVSFKEFIAGGGTVQEAMALMRDHAESTGVEITSMFGRTEAGQAALQLSSRNTEKHFNEAYKDMVGGVDTLQTSFDKLNNTDQAKMQRAMEKLKVASIELGQHLVPIATEIVQGVTNMAKAFNNLSPEMQGTIIKSLAFVAVGGKMMSLTGGLIETFGWLSKAFTGVGAASAVAGVGAVEAAGGVTLVAEAAGGTAFAMSGLASALPILFNPVTLVLAGTAAAIWGINKAYEKSIEPVTIFEEKSNELNMTLSETGDKVSDNAKHVETYRESAEKAQRETELFKDKQIELKEALDDGKMTFAEHKVAVKELEEAHKSGNSETEKGIEITKEMYEEYQVAYGDMVKINKHFNEETGESWETYSVVVSEKTREAVESFVETTDATTKMIADGWAQRDGITREGIDGIIAKENELKETSLAGLSEQHAEADRMTNEYFAKIGEAGSEAHALELESNAAFYETKKADTAASFDEITEILNTSYAEHGMITSAAMNEINALQKGATSKGIEALTSMELESAVIHEKMKSNNTKKTQEQAQEIVKSLNEQRDGVVKAAEEQKTESYKYAVELRKQGTEEANKKADEVIAAADKEYTEVVDKADGIRQDGLDMLKKEYGSLAEDIDANTGDIIGWWEGMFSKWKGWKPENKTATVTTEYRTVGKPNAGGYSPLPDQPVPMSAYATGTTYAAPGWAEINERGFEMIEMQGGEKVIPHDATKYALNRMLKQERDNKQQSVSVENKVNVTIESDYYNLFKAIRTEVKD